MRNSFLAISLFAQHLSKSNDLRIELDVQNLIDVTSIIFRLTCRRKMVERFIYMIEKFMGCRFYRPDDSQLPLRSIKTISNVEWNEKYIAKCRVEFQVRFCQFFLLEAWRRIYTDVCDLESRENPQCGLLGGLAKQQSASIIFFLWIWFRFSHFSSPYLR